MRLASDTFFLFFLTYLVGMFQNDVLLEPECILIQYYAGEYGFRQSSNSMIRLIRKGGEEGDKHPLHKDLLYFKKLTTEDCQGKNISHRIKNPNFSKFHDLKFQSTFLQILLIFQMLDLSELPIPKGAVSPPP